MKYEEYLKERKSKLDTLPIFFAFSDKQFDDEMKKRGLSGKDTKKVFSLGNGGYYLRSDAQIIRDFFNQKDELPELMKDREFAEGAFLYEMFNHEFAINMQGAWEVCECFGECEYQECKTGPEYLKEMGFGDETIAAYRAAKERYYDKVS